MILPPWTKLILPGMVLTLSATTIIQGQRMHAAKVERDQLQREATQWADRVQTQTQSIWSLVSVIDGYNAEAEQRAQDYEAVRAADASNRADADGKASITQAQIARLKQLGRDGTVPCGVSDDLRDALKGL